MGAARSTHRYPTVAGGRSASQSAQSSITQACNRLGRHYLRRSTVSFPGMQPYTAAEQAHFYGRKDETKNIVARLHVHRFLAILGASGSGKSSLLAAGIIPALQKSHYFHANSWQIREMRPGLTPCSRLADLLSLTVGQESDHALSSLPVTPDTNSLLVIDQYEELFTTSDQDQRHAFEHLLVQLVDRYPHVFIVVAARVDFIETLLASPLGPLISSHHIFVSPPQGEALRQAIVLPAQDVGVRLEPDLVVRLLADIGSEPGVLPFVQETLVMLWDDADRLEIGLDSYTDLIGDKSGRSGLQVALGQHAEHVYCDLLTNDEERAVAMSIFLRLVQFGEGRPDMRRQQTVAELTEGQVNIAFVELVLATLTTNRLLAVSDQAGSIDLSHEALIQGWPRLAQQVEKYRPVEAMRRRLESKADERQRLRQEDETSGLLDATELREAKEWLSKLAEAGLGVSEDLLALVRESESAVSHAATARHRRHVFYVALGTLALLAIAAAAILFVVSQNADIARQKASESAATSAIAASKEAHRAESEKLASLAQARMQNDEVYDDLALLLARDAISTTWYSPEHYVLPTADSVLRLAVDNASWRMTLPTPSEWHEGAINSVVYSLDGTKIATAGSDGTVRIWDPHTRQQLVEMKGHRGSVVAVAFSPDGAGLASASEDATLRLWDVATGEAVHVLDEGAADIHALAFSPDGSLLAIGDNSADVRLWDVQSRSTIRTLQGHSSWVNAVVFSPEGRMLASGSQDNTVRLWDVNTGESLYTLSGQDGSINALAFSPDGTILVSGSEDSTVWLWTAATGLPLRTLSGQHSGGVYSVSFSPDGSMLVSAGSGGIDGVSLVELWAVPSGQAIRSLTRHEFTISAVTFSPDGGAVASSSLDGTVHLWDLATARKSD